MPRLTTEQREEIFKQILENKEDVSIIVENLQMLRDDGNSSDELFTTMSEANSANETSLKDLQAKFYKTFMDGVSADEIPPIPTGSEINEEEVPETSYEDLLEN